MLKEKRKKGKIEIPIELRGKPFIICPVEIRQTEKDFIVMLPDVQRQGAIVTLVIP